MSLDYKPNTMQSGGGKRSLPDNVRLKLELLDERRFVSATIYAGSCIRSSENLPSETVWKSKRSVSMTYAPDHGKVLFDRSIRRRVGVFSYFLRRARQDSNLRPAD